MPPKKVKPGGKQNNSGHKPSINLKGISDEEKRDYYRLAMSKSRGEEILVQTRYVVLLIYCCHINTNK